MARNKSTLLDIPDDISLDPELFNSFVLQHGIRIQLEKAAVCPNYIGNVAQNYHDPNCNLCQNGFIHYATQQTVAVFQQNALQKMFLERGEFNMGQALMSFPSTDDNNVPLIIGLYDRITLLDQVERFYELKNKSAYDVDQLRYKALSIEFVTSQSRGVKNPFTTGTDFEVDPFGNLHWLPNGSRPSFNTATELGEPFIVSYQFQPVYRVLQLTHEGRYSSRLAALAETKEYTRFPQQVLVRKDYYLTKQDLAGINIKPPVHDQLNTDDPHEPANGSFRNE